MREFPLPEGVPVKPILMLYLNKNSGDISQVEFYYMNGEGLAQTSLGAFIPKELFPLSARADLEIEVAHYFAARLRWHQKLHELSSLLNWTV